MYLKVNFEKEVHLLNKKVDLLGLHQFIKASFKSVPDDFQLTYLDSDNDTICLSNEQDLSTLYSTLTEGFTRVTVRRLQEDQIEKQQPLVPEETEIIEKCQNKVAQESTEAKLEPQDAKEPLVEQQSPVPDTKGSDIVFDVPTEQKQQGKLLQQHDQKPTEQYIQSQLNSGQVLLVHPVASQNCESTIEKVRNEQPVLTMDQSLQSPQLPQCLSKSGSQSLTNNAQPLVKQNISNQGSHEDLKSDQMQKVVADKLQSLMPSIIKELRSAIGAEKEVCSQVTHPNIRCSQCSVLPIRGVRYQCPTCRDYNLCQKCENRLVHTHDLLKIRRPKQRYVEKRQIQNVKQEVPSAAKQETSKPMWQRKSDPNTLRSIIMSVQEVTGVSKESEEFAKANSTQGVDRIIDLWFSR